MWREGALYWCAKLPPWLLARRADPHCSVPPTSSWLFWAPGDMAWLVCHQCQGVHAHWELKPRNLGPVWTLTRKGTLPSLLEDISQVPQWTQMPLLWVTSGKTSQGALCLSSRIKTNFMEEARNGFPHMPILKMAKLRTCEGNGHRGSRVAWVFRPRSPHPSIPT